MAASNKIFDESLPCGLEAVGFCIHLALAWAVRFWWQNTDFRHGGVEGWKSNLIQLLIAWKMKPHTLPSNRITFKSEQLQGMCVLARVTSAWTQWTCLNAVNGKQPVRASRPTPPLGKHPGANFAKTYVDSSFKNILTWLSLELGKGETFFHDSAVNNAGCLRTLKFFL